jgi:hypothetical protein
MHTIEGVNFQLSEEHLAVRDAARDFAQNDLLPEVIERDIHTQFPTEEIKKMGELGFMGMMIDPQYGGSGMDTLSYVLAMEEICKVDASAGVAMSVNNSLVCYGLNQYGTEEQKQKYLKPLASGQILGAFCLSEPEAGSDATSQKTTAEWLALFGGSVPAAPVFDVAQALENPFAQEQQAVADFARREGGGPVRMLTGPVRVAGARPPTKAAPTLGADTADIL